MNYLKKRYFQFFFGLTLSILCAVVFFSFADSVLAQTNVQNGDVFGTSQIDQNVALGGSSLQKTVVRIINIGLGLLGIIAVGIVIYGGFVYMTSAGNEEKVAEAKKILVNGTIGLVIILSAWAITRFVLQKLGEATGVQGLGNDVPSACANAEFANNNPEQCFPGDFNIPGGENVDCAVKNKKTLLTRGITPSMGPAKTATGMNNAKVRVLFNNPLAQNDATKVFTVYRVENGQDVALNDSFNFSFVNDDPAFLQAVFQGQNGLDQLPQGEYKVKINRDLKGRENQNLAENVACGSFPLEASFTVDTNGVIDNQVPTVDTLSLNGKPADPAGESLNRGRVSTFQLKTTDNSGIGAVQYHVSVTKNGQQSSTFDYFDIPPVSRGSAATNQNPFVTKFPLIIPANAELFNEYTIIATVFDIDGNTSQFQFKGVIVGANCKPGDVGPECLDDNRACNSDLQCASKKCINNQCVAWPVITNVNGDSGVWSGAAGNYVTVEGNYFGENVGHVYFGYEEDGVAGGVRWIEATQPQCDGRDLWHNEWIIVSVPADNVLPQGKQAIIKVERAAEANQAQPFFDTTIDNRGPIPGPNHGRFIKDNTKRPGICSVGVAPGNASLPAGATVAPVNTAVDVKGTAFGPGATGQVQFGTAQGEVSGWADAVVNTRIPANLQSGKITIRVVQGGVSSNHFPFTVSSTVDSSLPTILSIDPVTTTRRSYVTITGRGFGDAAGEVFLAADANTDCRPNGGAINDAVCKLMDTRTCGETWSDTQIIAQVPENADLKTWVVKVKRSGDLLTSRDPIQLGVQAGGPNPGICYFNPKAGPAPLPAGSPGLKFRGVNFSDAPKIYFWPKGVDEKNIDLWYVQQGADIHRVESESPGAVVTVTTSIPVVNGATLAKGPTPIRIKNATGGVSNAVIYNVSDCRESAPMNGYQCCTQGPDAGFFKPNGQICKGQIRDAGYAWRFTTGRIPEIPQIVERCVTPTPEGEQPVFPSPAPWTNWLRNDLACINQSVVVQFSLPQGSSLENVNPNTVKVFKCDDKNGAIDCAGDKKVLVPYDNNDMALNGTYLTIISNPFQGPSQLEANSWYHVEISKTVRSFRTIQVANGSQEERQNLLVQRSCSNDTAYCFDFKTGSENNRCLLDRVGVIPHPYRVDYLGMLQLPAFYDPTRILNPAPSTTLYYKVWGTGSQNCSVLDVRGFNWIWDTTDATKATVRRTDRNDAEATVISLANTVPGNVGIRASSSTADGVKMGTGDLIIDLGEPKVTNFWPSCTESCVEAGLGVEFSRQMLQSSFVGNIRLYKCVDELCNNPADAFVATRETSKDYFTYRFVPNSGELDKSSWYKVVVSEGVQGVGSLGENQDDAHPEDDIGGKHMSEFTWRFRTTSAPDGKCVADKVEIQPRNFVAAKIGERTKFNAFPRTAPNKCSKLGQELNPWMYGWEWKIVTPGTDNAQARGQEVAQVSDFSLQGKIKPYCGLTCLPIGSDVQQIPQGQYPVCGDSIVGPGEDCDIAAPNEVPGVSCLLNCLRPGSKDAAICGNGVVDIAAGEECDYKNEQQAAFCTNTCNWKGSGSQVQNATSTAWCGSGSQTLGEDCDIASNATSTPEGKIGCSNQCLHVGTPTSQDWCTKHAENNYGDKKVKDLPECVSALSVCGNGIVEVGEECEPFASGNDVGIQVGLNIEAGRVVRALTNNPSAACSNRCILQNICNLNAIPLAANGGPRCERGTEGCTEGCRVAGSSVTYAQPSFCGDAKPGVGEYSMCEYAPGDVNAPPSLGQNPVQMVTAIGLGEINNQSRAQEADILAQVKSFRGANDEVKPAPSQPIGREKYSLQCGFTETVSTSTDPIVEIFASQPANDGNMEIAAGAVWNLLGVNAQKSQAEHVSGVRSLHVVGKGLISRELRNGVIPGRTYHLSFQYKIQSGQLWMFGFASTTPNMIAAAQTPILARMDADHLAEEIALHTVSSTQPQADWHLYERDIFFPYVENGHYGLSLFVAENSDFYIDDIKLEQVKTNTFVPTFNDCPENADNAQGVGTNSCCYARTHRVASVPNPGTTGVCRNAYLSVDFNGIIDKKSLENDSIVLVSGHAPTFNCERGTDVTDQVHDLLALNNLNSENSQPGFFGKIWNKVKQFFARIFDIQDVYAVVDHPETAVWCSHEGALVPSVTFEYAPDLSSSTSTVALQLNQALLPNTSYMLLVQGGSTGVKDIKGIGIRNPIEKKNGKYLLQDVIGFETGSDICKIDHVEVAPESYLFNKPNTTTTFQAEVISISRSQQIQPLPEIYAWDWSWAPQGNPLFDIPVEGTSTTTDQSVVGSKNVEGTLLGSALAVVTKDVSAENNHQGRVFSKSFELNADFCENPWPPREFFPYEEGVSFGKKRNQDGVTDAGVFNGSELAAIRLPNSMSDAYFQTSFSYCADANRSGNTDDDLPYLKPIVFGNKDQGTCQLPGAQAAGQQQAAAGVFGGAQGQAGQGNPFDAPLPDFGQVFGGQNNNNNDRSCSMDSQCSYLGKNATCANKRVVPDSTISGDTLKKFLFVNDKNDDAIGLQIMANPKRYTTRQWYEQQFPGSNMSGLRDITIGGYDAVTDGQSYYINALNQSGGPTSGIYNNIYIFSINGNAQTDTKKVFEQILTSLKLNINISDVGYCLTSSQNASGGSNPHETLQNNFNRLTEITSRACQTDFDCREAEGLPKDGTNGVCSNARTKLLRDWKRLADVRSTQKKLEVYKDNAGAGKYPQIEAGSFVQGYTNSRWGSWNILGQALGGALVDPINTWSKCGSYDSQTCWDAVSSTVHCPLVSSIIEYNVSTSTGYTLHVPFEYFTLTEPLNPVIGELVPNVNTVVTQPWCAADVAISAVGGECGNGVVNVASGEQCDPPGTSSVGREGLIVARPGKCEITNNECANSADCGFKLDFTQAIEDRTGIAQQREHVLGLASHQSYCASGDDTITGVILDDENKLSENEYPVFSCNLDLDCTKTKTYASSKRLSVRGQNGQARQNLNRDQFAAYLLQNANDMHCVKKVARLVIGESNEFPPQAEIACNGAVANGSVGACPNNKFATKMCNDSCQFEIGMCRSLSICGNGSVEPGESCDSGALNGSYGHCNNSCTGQFADYCGNGRIDTRGNGEPIEACEVVPAVQRSLPVADNKKMRVVYGSTFNIADFCHRTSADSEAACVITLGLFLGNSFQLNTDPAVLTHYCQNDPQLLCDPNLDEAGSNRDVDCIAPSSQTLLDFRIYNRENPRLADYTSADLSYYGPCVAKRSQKFGSEYNTNKDLSCKGDCSAVGEYCGDGKLQAEFEECDDGNTVGGDGCTAICRDERPQAAVNAQPAAAAPLACGNGQVDVDEVCDLAGDNGKVCTPQYGRSCTYCSADCRNVLTVDPNAFCGDNIFEQGAEQCDVVNGSVVAATSTPGGRLVCADNYKGEYSCNQCNGIQSTCVQCKSETLLEGGIVPQISYLNPITNRLAQNPAWVDASGYSLYVKREVANTRQVNFYTIDEAPPEGQLAVNLNGAQVNLGGGGVIGAGAQQHVEGINFGYLDRIQHNDLFQGSTFHKILGANLGIETNTLCREEYGVVLNASEMLNINESCGRGVVNCTAGDYLMSDKADFFAYPAIPEGRVINNEYILSPAVPEGFIRVVVRWGKEENDEGYVFTGMLHNAGFSAANRTLHFGDVSNNRLCNSIRLNGQNVTYPNYWFPNCDNNFIENSVYVHPVFSGQKNFIQSMTIQLNGGKDVAHAAERRNYAFVVEGLNQGGVIPMGSVVGKDVFVDVYVYHPNQNPKFSIYKPAYSFSISAAGGSNPLGGYWHVFNLEFIDGAYRVRAPRNRVGDHFDYGKIATCENDIWCYLPETDPRHEQCNPQVMCN